MFIWTDGQGKWISKSVTQYASVLDALSLALPAMVQLVVFFNSGSQWVRFSQEYLTLFNHSDQLDFVSSLWCID